ncbi:MAG: chorismate--pyruvate lyase [Lachnospiraceae bacterium]|nr:chorismate--pyruvate lyase [Lachnospiraceae bacterium]
MFERVDYTVARIDGDYAYLLRADDSSAEEKCVARALLPPEIYEGCKVKYEMLSYEMI